MKAAVFYGTRDIRVEEVDKPKLESGEILIKVRACGICGSDVHAYKHGVFSVIGVTVGDNRMILGHEYSGDVVEVSEDVKRAKVGDRVSAVSFGAMAEYVKASASPSSNLVIVPSEVSYEEAATNEPLGISLHSVNLANPVEGETILIAGAGIIGLGIIQVLKAINKNNRIIVADISPKRLAMAKRLGADDIINPSTTNLAEKVSELLGTWPMNFAPGVTTSALDIAFECAGSTADSTNIPVLEQLLYIVRQSARIVLVGTHDDRLPLDVNVMIGQSLRLLGSVAYSLDELSESMKMIRSGRIVRKPLISHEFSLNDAKEAFETQLITDQSIKVIVKP